MEKKEAIKNVLNGYVDSALFSSTDGNGNLLDSMFDRSHIAKETMDFFLEDVTCFVDEFWNIFNQFDNEKCRAAGIDFWLTRNGHGSGFWDGDWDNTLPDIDVGSIFDEYSKSVGSCDLYVSDNGYIFNL